MPMLIPNVGPECSRSLLLRPSLGLLDLVHQNVELNGAPHLTGTELAAQLRARGFSGVVCILTGSSKQTITSLSAEKGVDLVR